MPARTLSPVLLASLALLATGCGGEHEASAAPGTPAAARPRDPELDPVRAALEAGRPDQALGLLEGFTTFEAICLRARAQSMDRDQVAALRSIEEARALAPDHPDLFATEAEILAAADHLQGAAEVLEKGFQRCGRDAALERARGVVHLRHSGQARAALEALERARALDPGLPFLRWPLAQAHVLVGRAQLQDAAGESLAHARAAQGLEPGLYDARELEAEALAATFDFEGALEQYGALEAEGHDFGETPAILHQRFATFLLLNHDRERAVEQYLAARALGMDDEGLGYGVDVLEGAARAAIDAGIERAEADDWEGARPSFERALELDPSSLEAANHLAVARFQLGDYAGAAAGWQDVWGRAQVSGTVLPDPVPLNLARAWRLAGRPEQARAVLDDYLDAEPEGAWSEGARELLLALEAEALASAAR